MRKMKKLFKIRNGLIPLFHWGVIHFILTTASLLTFIFTLFFTGITGTMCIWFIVSMIQYLPVFVVMAGQYIFETILYKKTLTIIKRKLAENNIDIKSLNVSVDDFTLHSCTFCIDKSLVSSANYEKFADIIHRMNRNFGNGYRIICVDQKSEDTN